MSALRAGGDVVIFAAGLGAWVATLTTAQTAPGIIWGTVSILFGMSALWVAWGIYVDALETDDPAEITRPVPAPRQWTPADTREDSGRSNSFGGERYTHRPDAWADDPDRTTRRETWEG